MATWLFNAGAKFWYVITSAGAAHFGSAGILPIRVATDVVFVEVLFTFPIFFY